VRKRRSYKLEHFHRLADYRKINLGESGDIAAGVSQAGDEALNHGLVDLCVPKT
jgi:hypothetical protein